MKDSHTNPYVEPERTKDHQEEPHAPTHAKRVALFPFKDRLANIITAEDPQFVENLKRIKSTLDEFHKQIQWLVPKKKFTLTTSIQGIGGGSTTEFQYVLNFEVLATGASYDLLTFLFSPFLGETDFPLRLIIEPERAPQERLGCESMVEFEEFLVERAKDIRRTLQMLSIVADQ